MDTFRWILIIGALAYLVYRLMPVRGIAQITSEEAKEKMNDNSVQFVDVRTAQEFRSQAIEAFRNIPLNEIGRKSNELDKNREVVLLCASGIRSNQAAKILKRQGFLKVSNVKGGLGAWNH